MYLVSFPCGSLHVFFTQNYPPKPIAGTPDTTPGRTDSRHGGADSDAESIELGNLSMDLPDDEDDEEPQRRRAEMMLPRIPVKVRMLQM